MNPRGLLLSIVLGGSLVSTGVGEMARSDVLFEDTKLRVYEVHFAPDAETRTIERPRRVVRALTAGTLERTLADGTIEREDWKAGQVRVIEADRVRIKNVGGAPISLYIVQLKN